MEELDKWKRRFERERSARREAEHLLENKSLELYEANRRLAEEVVQKGSALEEQEELFETIFHASKDGIVLLNGRGKMIEVNQAVLKMLGFAKKQILGKGGMRMFSVEDRKLARDAFRQVMKTGYCRYEATLVRSDGSFFPAEIVGSRALVGGKVIINGVIRDVTQRRRRVADLKAARDESERANEAKSLFLASMSHEIRTPLNGVLGFTEVVLGSELSEEQRRNLELVKSSADILLLTINDLLDFSKIESGQLLLESKGFDLRKMLEELIQMNSPSALAKGLEVSLTIDESLPKVIKGDLVRVRQVVTNLVSNAVKFTKRGFVRVGVKGVSGELEVTVEDSGIGFEPAMSEALFEAFSQADVSTTRKFGGTGLGLAICRKLALAMGGNISAHGELGHGAVFVFSLPFIGGEKGEEKLLEARFDQADLPGVQREQRILIAEDNGINARLAMIVLKRLGYESEVATTGAEVLALLQSNAKFHAILMDLHMQEMDGVEATRRIRTGEAGERWVAIPIIAITASGLDEDREACRDAGMTDFLLKPLRPADLEGVLTRLL